MATPNETGNLFTDRLDKLLASTNTAAAIALGGELGIFDVLVKMDKPRTSQEIADATGYRERYIRAWLQSMVVGDVIQYDADEKVYFLPRHRIPYLSEAVKTNIVPAFQLTFAYIEHYQALLKCFKPDGPGGIDPDVYDVHNIKRKLNKKLHPPEKIGEMLSQVPGLTAKLEKGIQVCEFGCGRGHTTFIIAAMYPNSTVYGSDVTPDTITQNTAEAVKRGLKNIYFEVADLHNLPSEDTNRWDYAITFDVIHDLPYPDQALKELHRCVKPGGYYSISDINLHSELKQNMQSKFRHTFYFTNLFYCMPISLFFKNGKGLGPIWGKELAEKMLKEAGFKDVKILAKDEDRDFHGMCLK